MLGCQHDDIRCHPGRVGQKKLIVELAVGYEAGLHLDPRVLLHELVDHLLHHRFAEAGPAVEEFELDLLLGG